MLFVTEPFLPPWWLVAVCCREGPPITLLGRAVCVRLDCPDAESSMEGSGVSSRSVGLLEHQDVQVS